MTGLTFDRRQGPGSGAGGFVVEGAMRVAGCIAVFTIVGVYASILGFSLAVSGIVGAVVAGFVLRQGRTLLGSSAASSDTGTRDTPAGTSVLAAMLVLSLVVAVVLPNDVNNTDPAEQVALVQQAAYYHTLLTPGFFSDRGTKYDGWTFLHAVAALGSRVPPVTLMRYSKLLLLPCMILALYAVIRALGLGGIHLVMAVALALLVSGDSFRIISMGGPRSWAYVFQIFGLASLLGMTPEAGGKARLAAVRAALFFAGSAIFHLFFGLANALIVAIVCALALNTRRRREWLRPLLVLSTVFALASAPYGYVKSGQALTAGDTSAPPAPGWLPEYLPVQANAARAEREIRTRDLLSFYWGEYGSLIPLFLVPLFWIDGSRPARSIALYVVLFAVPCAVVAIAPLRDLAIGTLAASRVFRILPLSPAVAAIVAYASGIFAGTSSRTRVGRLAARAILVLALAALMPSVRPTWNWYVKVYPSTVVAGTSDRSYISVGLLLQLGTEAWPPVVTSSAPVALKLAAVTNRPVAFYLKGQRHWATRADTIIDPNQDRAVPWEFVVDRVTDPFPEAASCRELLYSDDGIRLCATRQGQASWSYAGIGQRTRLAAATDKGN
jgi:hypothetical protein